VCEDGSGDIRVDPKLQFSFSGSWDPQVLRHLKNHIIQKPDRGRKIQLALPASLSEQLLARRGCKAPFILSRNLPKSLERPKITAQMLHCRGSPCSCSRQWTHLRKTFKTC
jgi:hypothetical protein